MFFQANQELMNTYLYFIGAAGREDPIKIGITDNLEDRLRQLQTGASRPLKIIAQFPMESRQLALTAERELHSKYANYRLKGEWFRPKIMRKILRQMTGKRVTYPNQAIRELKAISDGT